MNFRHLLAYAYVFGASTVALVIVKAGVAKGALAYAPVLYPVSIGAGLIVADAIGVRFHRTTFYMGVFRVRVLGALFLVLGVLFWFSGDWKQ